MKRIKTKTMTSITNRDLILTERQEEILLKSEVKALLNNLYAHSSALMANHIMKGFQADYELNELYFQLDDYFKSTKKDQLIFYWLHCTYISDTAIYRQILYANKFDVYIDYTDRKIAVWFKDKDSIAIRNRGIGNERNGLQ